MSRISIICIVFVTLISGFVSCNSSSVEEDLEITGIYSTAIVKDFHIKENDKVLDNLQNVFFSINLNEGLIFNADSMPYGTDVHALIPSITTGGASSVELSEPRPGKTDSIHNYLTNPNDSIDFSNGPVKLKILSIDGLTTMEYSISVNVHKVKSDSLSWGEIAYSQLPTNLQAVKNQHTLKFKGNAYCLTSDGNNHCLATTTNPASNQWQLANFTPGFKPDVNSFSASSDALYILDNLHQLYKSTDNGQSWSLTSYKFDYIIGGYEDCVIGTVNENGSWKIKDTNGNVWDADIDFPVCGSSAPIVYGFDMAKNKQLTIVGGRTEYGLTPASWGFDGTQWACLSANLLPQALEGMTVVPYFVFEENSFFIASKHSIFLAFGGKDDDGNLNTKTYISYNYGVSWSEAPELMQLPSNVEPRAFAQGLIFTTELSRASTAITQWECPYIYLFGGQDAAGNTFTTVHRAVINRLQFKPLQ